MASTPIRPTTTHTDTYELTFVGGEVICISNPATIGLFWVLIFLMTLNTCILIRIILRNK